MKTGVDPLREHIRVLYAKANKTTDLEHSACTCADAPPSFIAALQAKLPESVLAASYGCGTVMPSDYENLRGLRIADFAGGAGPDAYVLRLLAGRGGHVTNLDMTLEQLQKARRYTTQFLKENNLAPNSLIHRKGYMELARGIGSGTMDLVVSNCVVNLSPDPRLVMQAKHRVLKIGGELYFSDVISDRRNDHLRDDPTLVAECIGRAPYEQDLRDAMLTAGFGDVREISRAVMTKPDQLKDDPATFYKVVWRAFKLPEMDTLCEDYGQFAIYNGNIKTSPTFFVFDDHHIFERDKPILVCRNTARMLDETRLAKSFTVSQPIRHFGEFPCGPAPTGASGLEKSCC
ncbi:MAG: arsenite methyltransferase [Candidatus Woesearchaeota archaeon]|jgi:arsenite methyltransferase